MAPVTTLDLAQFRAALSRFASGVTVVTVRGGDGSDAEERHRQDGSGQPLAASHAGS